MSTFMFAPIRLITRRTRSRTSIRHTGGIIGDSLLERKRPGPARHILSTLDQNLLKSKDVLNPSQKKSITIRFPDSVGPGPGAQLRYAEAQAPIPFPPHSRGFLYYDSGARAEPLEGSLSFRVTSDNTPASFLRGHDLLAPCGLPWRITLPQIACQPGYTRIREHLLRENLATEEQLSLCRDIFREHRIYPEYTLFRLDSLFFVDFSTNPCLTAVGDALHPFRPKPFVEFAAKDYFPWSGSALARFEPSTRPENTGRRVVHLRIVKIVKPVACTVKGGYAGRVVKPKEGELLNVFLHGSALEPWAYDIDHRTGKPNSAALRVLWDKSSVS
ncbi:hypothetical protein C8R44DRAFT_985797 [Mycena epipterygia]|nr:hypothetical protein C8R44DRAFT_985797 [Mycena epipterygia]